MRKPKNNLPEKEGTVNLTVIAPESIWRAMKSRAMDRRVSANQIWLEAARMYLEAERDNAAA